MFCSNCGSHLNDDAKFCSQCGAKVESLNESIATDVKTHDRDELIDNSNIIEPKETVEAHDMSNHVVDSVKTKEENEGRKVTFDWSGVVEEPHHKVIEDIKSPWDDIENEEPSRVIPMNIKSPWEDGDDYDSVNLHNGLDESELNKTASVMGTAYEDRSISSLSQGLNRSDFEQNPADKGKTLTFIDILMQEKAENERKLQSNRSDSGSTEDEYIFGDEENKLVSDKEMEVTQGYTDLKDDIIAALSNEEDDDLDEEKEDADIKIEDKNKSFFEYPESFPKDKTDEFPNVQVGELNDKQGSDKDLEEELVRILGDESEFMKEKDSEDDIFFKDLKNDVEDKDTPIFNLEQEDIDIKDSDYEAKDKENKVNDDIESLYMDYNPVKTTSRKTLFGDLDLEESEDEKEESSDNSEDEKIKALKNEIEKLKAQIANAKVSDEEKLPVSTGEKETEKKDSDEPEISDGKEEISKEAPNMNHIEGMDAELAALGFDIEPIDSKEEPDAPLKDKKEEDIIAPNEENEEKGEENIKALSENKEESFNENEPEKPEIQPIIEDKVEKEPKAKAEEVVKKDEDMLFNAESISTADKNEQGEALTLAQLEKELFGDDFEDNDVEATKKIEKFYTLYRKNEEFQNLLDEEYDKLQNGSSDYTLMYEAKNEKTEELEEQKKDEIFDSTEKNETPDQSAMPSISTESIKKDSEIKKEPPKPETVSSKEELVKDKGDEKIGVLSIIAILVAIVLVLMLVGILIMTFAPDSSIAMSLGNFIDRATHLVAHGNVGNGAWF